MTGHTDYKVYATDGTHEITRMTSLTEKKKRRKKDSGKKRRSGGAKATGVDDRTDGEKEQEDANKKTEGHDDHKVDYYA